MNQKPKVHCMTTTAPHFCAPTKWHDSSQYLPATKVDIPFHLLHTFPALHSFVSVPIFVLSVPLLACVNLHILPSALIPLALLNIPGATLLFLLTSSCSYSTYFCGRLGAIASLS